MKKVNIKSVNYYLSLIICVLVFLTGCANTTTNINNSDNKKAPVQNTEELTTDKVVNKNEESLNENINEYKTETYDTAIKSATNNEEDIFDGYKLIEVDGGDLSGHREPNVVVDIGFGDRKYWAFTNEHGQLVKVVADKIILQDDSKEPVTSKGRYYPDEAKVPGVESKYLDEGHIIADSLGGVSNAYNITPQNSTLNRHGDQAYMEKAIRDAGGCTDFVAIITYPNTKTQIPSHYSYTYTIKGRVINDEFDNVNPDEYNAKLNDSANKNSSNKVNNATSNSISTSSSKNESQSSVNNTSIVYWTPNGKSYHTTKNCSTLSRSKTILEGSINESGKHDPCDKCH